MSKEAQVDFNTAWDGTAWYVSHCCNGSLVWSNMGVVVVVDKMSTSYPLALWHLQHLLLACFIQASHVVGVQSSLVERCLIPLGQVPAAGTGSGAAWGSLSRTSLECDFGISFKLLQYFWFQELRQQVHWCRWASWTLWVLYGVVFLGGLWNSEISSKCWGPSGSMMFAFFGIGYLTGAWSIGK